MPIRYEIGDDGRVRRVNKPRDSQRSKVYGWEAKWKTDRHKLTQQECLALVAEVSHCYLPYCPVVEFKLKSGWARAYGVGKIRLPKWAENRVVLLHEMAHIILEYHVRQNNLEEVASHGKEFVRLFIRLLSQFAGMNEKELIEQAKQAKLKVGVSTKLPLTNKQREKVAS